MIKPSLQVIGKENIPQSGPCVVTVNHYFRPGFGAEWLALGISAVVPRELHWIMTGEWTAPGKWYEPLKAAYSRLLLKYLARVYDYTTMPPMPPRSKDVEARARSVRAALEYARRHLDFMLGLAPEGAEQPGGKLTMPAPGVGRFALLLAGLGSAFAPVGVYEEAGAFCLHFGPAYRLEVPPSLSADEKDRLAAEIMMKNIAVLLPERLRGNFQ
jgi:1-acyl-sn-glycerol-3-phosphate acyltransferase